MVRVRGLKIIFLIAAMLLMFTYLCIPSSAEEVIGINVSKTQIERGETVDVIVLSPVLPDNADSTSLKVYYDSDVFDVVSSAWSVDISGVTNKTLYSTNVGSDEGGSFICLAAASGNYNTTTGIGGMDVKDKQVRFSTTLRVKSNTRKSTVSDFILDSHSIAHSIEMENGSDRYVEMWGDAGVTSAHVDLINNLPVSDDGGISIYENGADIDYATVGDPGDTVTVHVQVPAIAWDADPAQFSMTYDTTRFVFSSWGTGTSTTGTKTVGDGTITVTDLDNNLGLDNVQDYYAIFKVKENAPKNTDPADPSTFTLTPDIAADGTSLWNPTKTVASVYVTGLPKIDGGLTLDRTTVNRDNKETVNAKITIPAITDAAADSADGGEIRIYYDNSAFTVGSGFPSITNLSFSDKGSYVSITPTGDLDLSSGLEFSVGFTPKTDAKFDTYTFSLDGTAFESGLTKQMLTPSGTARTQRVWLPADDKKTASVGITGNTYKDGGIYVSKLSGTAVPLIQADPGETFNVIIKIPEIKTDIETLEIVAGFNKNTFEVAPITVSGLTAVVNNDTGKISIIGTGVSLKDGLTIKAEATAKYTAKIGTYDFDLTTASAKYRKYSGETENIWVPATTKAQVKIKSENPTFPVTSKGISVSPNRVKAGNTFTATIEIPELNATAEKISLNALFDPSIFKILSVTSSDNTIKPVYDDGYIYVDATGLNFSLSKGLKITANLQVLSTAPVGKYDITLHTAEVIGSAGTVVISQPLWYPEYTTATVTVPSPEDDYPVSGGGLSLSQTAVYTGGQFTVYIKIPAIDVTADNATFTVDFDPNAFDVVTWDPRLTNGYPTIGSGAINLTVSGGTGLNLRNGLTLSATLKAKANATPGKYTFRLSRSSITVSGISKELWAPVTYYEDLTVSSSSNNNNPYYPNYPNYTNPWYNPYQYPIIYYTDSKDNKRDDNIVYAPDDDDDSTVSARDDDDVIGNSSKNNVKIELNGDLRNVTNSGIKARTKKSFFSGDTIIIIRNTDLADMSAATALSHLSMSNCQSYAFDVSVYDCATGKYIHSITGGYIDISIPVPTVFTGSSDKIAVYHVDGGNPEYISSEIVYEDGIRKVKFRASSFSPYMFVDPTSVKSGSNNNTGNNYTVVPNNNNNNGGTTYYAGDTTGGGSRPANPGTGSTVAIILIPAATLGCVLLAKKSGKRKRSGRR
jgi:hypothetical protein